MLQARLDDVFSDENILDPANNFVFERQGANNESYIAATMTDAIFGEVEWTLERDLAHRNRAHAGKTTVRRPLSWNPYGFSRADPQVTTDPEVLRRGTFASDDHLPVGVA